jgi:2-polyprenyl-6-methoxyphenol hydroxylase-like FAD-dependent oxidoreductase
MRHHRSAIRDRIGPRLRPIARTALVGVIVGGSLAGCATAIHLGRAGWRVALVERRPDPAAYKRVCGHFIQASGVPALARLGVLGEIEAAGAVRGRPRVWTRYGWIDAERGDGHPGDDARDRRSLSIRREVLDPLLRRRAAATPGVEMLLGHSLEALEPLDGGRRVRLAGRRAAARTLSTRLVVGADGRGSRTAKLAGVRTRTSTNARCAYWGYFEGPPLGTGASVHIWLDGPEVGIVTPTDGDLTLYVAFPSRERAPEFKHDVEGRLRAFVGALPDAPPIAESRVAGPLVGKVDLTNEWRRSTGDALALVGDAALAADPVGAIGCGWALQSAEWLGEALASEPRLETALRRYRRRHRRELLGHSLMAADGARGKAMSPVQRLIFSAAVEDPVTAGRVEDFAARFERPRRLLSPRTLARAARVNARTRAPARWRAARTAAP